MVNKLRKEFEKIYYSNISTTKGLEKLAINIGISKNSMRRFLGKIKSDGELRNSTLNLISVRLGYRNFQDFCESYGTNQTNQDLIDFGMLDIYYGVVKGKGTRLNETLFQKANYFFAEKIISHPKNLTEFVKRFAENEEAMEYVLAWHPSYLHISFVHYQEALLKLARSSHKEHIKVFAYSFVYFGKFISENLTQENAEKLMRKIEKSVVKMRLQSPEFMTFPEARFCIAKLIHAKYYTKTTDKNGNLKTQHFKNMVNDSEFSFSDRFIYRTYIGNMLNFLQEYEYALEYLNEILSEKNLALFVSENPHLKVHLYLYKLSRATSMFHLQLKSEAIEIFESLPNDINDLKSFAFDTKIFFEIQYYILGRKLFPKREDYQQKLEDLLLKTNFTFFNHI